MGFSALRRSMLTPADARAGRTPAISAAHSSSEIGRFMATSSSSWGAAYAFESTLRARSFGAGPRARRRSLRGFAGAEGRFAFLHERADALGRVGRRPALGLGLGLGREALGERAREPRAQRLLGEPHAGLRRGCQALGERLHLAGEAVVRPDAIDEADPPRRARVDHVPGPAPREHPRGALTARDERCDAQV